METTAASYQTSPLCKSSKITYLIWSSLLNEVLFSGEKDNPSNRLDCLSDLTLSPKVTDPVSAWCSTVAEEHVREPGWVMKHCSTASGALLSAVGGEVPVVVTSSTEDMAVEDVPCRRLGELLGLPFPCWVRGGGPNPPFLLLLLLLRDPLDELDSLSRCCKAVLSRDFDTGLQHGTILAQNIGSG